MRTSRSSARVVSMRVPLTSRMMSPRCRPVCPAGVLRETSVTTTPEVVWRERRPISSATAGERFTTEAPVKGELPPIDAAVFAHTALAYELAYGKGLTPFLRLAQNTGVPRLADGVGMLVEQAAEAWVWWHRVRPQTKAVIDKLTVPLK